MAPPPIETSGAHFFSPRGPAAAQRRNEVVIDGESSSTDSEEEVMVITPQSRKRKRTTAVVDEDDEGSGDNDDGNARGTDVVHTTAAAQENEADEDDDDDVEIVQIGAATTPLDGSASKKSRRLTIPESQDSDDDATDQQARATPARNQRTPNRRHSTGGIFHTPIACTTPGSSTSSARRSSRIEHRRLEKVSEPSAVRKLQLVSLDNCLDKAQSGRKDDDDDDDDFEDEEGDGEEEEDDGSSLNPHHGKKAQRGSRRSPPRESEREVLHADGDDDLDEFIVDDNEVEYMDDDDENGVISVGSGSDVDGEDELETFAAIRAAQQTREPKEWFEIYIEYLEESILDAALDSKMRLRPNKPDYQLYREAIHHIERAICSRRDNLRGNVVWPDEMMDALRRASFFRTSRCQGEQDCEACNRQNHIATFHAHLGGIACDATELYREDWMAKFRKSTLVRKSVNATFEMGSVCHARTLAYWQLLHAKQFWCILVDAKRKECGDVTGRISSQHRTAFINAEYGRFKRLRDIVDDFDSVARQSSARMVNVWKKVTPQHLTSEFFPSTKRSSTSADESRRGLMDAFVAESEDEEGNDSEEDEEEEEEIEMKRAPPATDSTTANAVKSESTSTSTSSVKVENADVEDLLCLVCGENPRNGGIVHGQYLHFYCCFRCGKRQLRAGMGCLVCDRPIDKVLRLLPLTPETRKAIQENK